MVIFRSNERGDVARPPVLTDTEIARLVETAPPPRKPNVSVAVPVPSVAPLPQGVDRATTRRVLAGVARSFQITVAAMTAASDVRKRRPDSVVRPRQVAAYLLRRLGASYPEAARAVGLADHSTAIHAEKKIDELLREDPVLAHRVAHVVVALRLA